MQVPDNNSYQTLYIFLNWDLFKKFGFLGVSGPYLVSSCSESVSFSNNFSVKVSHNLYVPNLCVLQIQHHQWIYLDCFLAVFSYASPNWAF